ncbi:MAG: hypothetical protein NXI00_24405, partial [Cytophagales bacterium]|nr:hypothetical protein [Cytophagales bacterium]
DFEQALERDVNNEQAYYGMGRAYLKLKEFKKSSENLELAILIDPNFVQAYEVLAMAYSGLNKLDSSNAIITRAIEMGSTNPLRFYIRGLNYYGKEDYFNAVKEFEKSKEFLSDKPDLFLNLAYSYLFLENYVKGCEHLNWSAELGSKQAIEDLNVYCP